MPKRRLFKDSGAELARLGIDHKEFEHYEGHPEGRCAGVIIDGLLPNSRERMEGYRWKLQLPGKSWQAYNCVTLIEAVEFVKTWLLKAQT